MKRRPRIGFVNLEPPIDPPDVWEDDEERDLDEDEEEQDNNEYNDSDDRHEEYRDRLMGL